MIGELRNVVIEPLATVLTATVRPPQGTEWQVLTGGAEHTDAAARNVIWTFTDSKRNISWDRKSVTAMPAGWQFGINENNVYVGAGVFASSAADTMLLRNDLYAVASVDALAAGMFLKVGLIVMERPENFDLQVVEMFANYMGYKLPIISRE